jgi:GNAT superfamily N-acetyltransferase
VLEYKAVRDLGGGVLVYTIRRGTPADQEPVSALIADAFGDLPVARWLVPPPAERKAVLVANFHIHADHALTHGMVDIASDERTEYAGVAVWFPQPNPPSIANYKVRLAAACGRHTPRFRELDKMFEANHPQGEEHHHLTFLAAARQGHGVGTALLAHHHEKLDDLGLPAYLEASSERSRNLYLRQGYRGDAPFHLPRGGPPLWPMWRKPS